MQWEIYTHGGRKPTGIDAVEWARRMVDYGAGEILLTSMDRDGTRAGFDLELTLRSDYHLRGLLSHFLEDRIQPFFIQAGNIRAFRIRGFPFV